MNPKQFAPLMAVMLMAVILSADAQNNGTASTTARADSNNTTNDALNLKFPKGKAFGVVGKGEGGIRGIAKGLMKQFQQAVDKMNGKMNAKMNGKWQGQGKGKGRGKGKGKGQGTPQ